MRGLFRLLIICVFASVILSCGGGGDSGSSAYPGASLTVIPPTNLKPTSNAGTDKSVNINDHITLDGSHSADPENDLLNYQWSLTSIPEGSLVVLDDPSSQKPSFTIDIAGTYIASLTVTDGQNNSDQDFVIITTLSISPVTVSVPSTLQNSGLKLLTGDMTAAASLIDGSEADVILGDSNQTLIVTDSIDNVVYLGIVNSNSADTTVINEKSTADALVILFPMISYIITENPDREIEIIDLIASLPEITSLANIIKARIDSGNTSLVPMDDVLRTGLTTAIDAATQSINELLTKNNVVIASKSNEAIVSAIVSLSLEGEQSGLTVTNTPIVNPESETNRTHQITINNSYERYVTAGIYQNGSRVEPESSERILVINPGGTGQLTIQSNSFIDETVTVEVFGPGFSTKSNGLNPEWSDPRVRSPTLKTVIAKISLPVLRAILGVSESCSAIPTADEIFTDVFVDAEVTNDVSSGDMSIIALTVLEKVLAKSLSNFAESLLDCGAEKAILKLMTPIVREISLAYRVASTSLTVGEVAIDITNSHRHESWSLTNTIDVPEISFTPVPVNAVAPVEVTFVGECTDEEDYLIDGKHDWDFGDVNSGTRNQIATGIVGSNEVSHLFQQSGNYTISLTCTDEDGASKSTSIPLAIEQAQPTIEVSVPTLARTLINNEVTPINFGEHTLGSAGNTIQFTVNNTGTGDSTNPDHNLNISNISSSNSNFVVMGQSGTSVPTGGSVTFDVQYFPNVEGESAGIITLSTNDFEQSSFTFNISGTGVVNQPVANFTISATKGDINTVFQVDASSSTDQEDALEQLQFRWNWDAAEFPVWDGISYSSNPTSSHTFSSIGGYRVWLQVMDSAGNTDLYSIWVQVISQIREYTFPSVYNASAQLENFDFITIEDLQLGMLLAGKESFWYTATGTGYVNVFIYDYDNPEILIYKFGVGSDTGYWSNRDRADWLPSLGERLLGRTVLLHIGYSN